jgi:hypothetical protein
MLRSADLLFLPMHAMPPGSRAGLIPAKTYEYLAARRPILAAVPEGDARDLLEESGAATLVAPGDAEGLLRAVRVHVSSWREGKQPFTPPSRVLKRFAYRNIASDVAYVLAHAVEARREPLRGSGRPLRAT